MMTVRDMLGRLDNEVWAVFRPIPRCGEPGRFVQMDDIIVWSADWHGANNIPDNLWNILNWMVDDISIEMREDPERHEVTPMLVMDAYC